MKLTNLEAANLHAAAASVTADVDMPYEGRLSCAMAIKALTPFVSAFNASRQAAIRKSGLKPNERGQMERDQNPSAFDGLETELAALDEKVVEVKLTKMKKDHLGTPKLHAAHLAALLVLVE